MAGRQDPSSAVVAPNTATFALASGILTGNCSLLNTVVPTGRLACAGPNLQQIPRSKEVPLRRAFKPRPGKVLFDVDYSQIELRIFAEDD